MKPRPTAAERLGRWLHTMARKADRKLTPWDRLEDWRKARYLKVAEALLTDPPLVLRRAVLRMEGGEHGQG